MTDRGPVAELAELLGSRHVLTDDDAAPYLVDWRATYSGSAMAIVRPGSTDEVAAVMRWAADRDVAVVTQGGNTGMSGAATPVTDRPAIVMSMRRMNTIESIDPDRWTMTVQAGVTIESMHEAAATVDRLFAPDWGARGTATIGGAIATDAGGNNVVRYGNLRDQLLGLEVVLADGRVWDGLRALRKDSSGYDLKQLFIGAEGTLGVVTRAVVTLHPATPFSQSALAALTDLGRIMDLFALARDIAPDALVAFELMPQYGIDLVCREFEIAAPLDADTAFSVLVRFADGRAVTDRLTEFASRGVAAGLLADVVVAATPDQEERLWMIRDELSPSVRFPERHRVGLKMDAAVPIDRIGDFHDAVVDLASGVVPGSVVYAFGHVGDGNLHLYVLPADESQYSAFGEVKAELTRRVDDIVFSMGGTLSAEHGIGRELRGRIVGQKPMIEWELMRAIKTVLDPDGRLNPGAVLPD